LQVAVAQQALQLVNRQAVFQLMGGIGVTLMPNSA
jgi:hypothetical protein